MARTIDVVNQRRIMLVSFMYFSMVIKINKIEPSQYLISMYRNVGRITNSYRKYMEEDMSVINKIIKRFESENSEKENLEIDYLLASVSIISSFYDQTKGKKRFFYPMSYKDILELQDEIIDDLTEKDSEFMIKNTFDFCDYVVREILRGK